MKAKLFIAAIVPAVFLIVTACGGQSKQTALAGAVTFKLGNATVESTTGGKKQLKVGDVINKGDVIRTGKASTLIITFNQKVAEVEIQQNAEFSIDAFAADKKHFNLRKGNAWFRSNKLRKGEDVKLISPTAIAGVRGTKFYTFKMGPFHGTCHCEGKVDFEVGQSKYKQHHEKDFVVLTKDKKTVLLTPADMSKIMGMKPEDMVHRHSSHAGSALGPKDRAMNKEQQARFMQIVTAKFAAAKAAE